MRTRLVLILFAIAAMVNCSKHSTKPVDVQYTIYASDTYTRALYHIDPETLTIFDSIPDFYDLRKMVVSPDGRWLYAETRADPNDYQRILKIDVAAKQIVNSYTSAAWSDLALTSDGKYLIRAFCGIQLMTTDPFAIVHEVEAGMCSLPPYPGIRYLAGQNVFIGGDTVFVYDLQNKMFTHKFMAKTTDGEAVTANNAIVHPDGRRVIVIGSEYAVIYDLLLDTTVYSRRLNSHGTSIALTADGSYVLIGDVAHCPSFCYGSDVLEILDLNSLVLVQQFDSSTGMRGGANLIALIDESRSAVVAPDWPEYPVISVVDLETLAVIASKIPEGLHSIRSLAAGIRPE